MPYRKRIFTYPGGRVEEKYFTCRLGGKKTRIKNFNKTPEAVAKVNARRAVRHLEEILLTNFRQGDQYITLTYAEEPKDYDEAIRHLTNYIKRLRRRYQRVGQELRYIYTTEYKGKRIHHHILVNKVLEQQELRDTWRHSKLSAYDIIEYQGGERDAKKLAAYFTKESNITVREGKQKVRYVASRNLKKPEVHYQTIQSKKWRERPTAKKGYALVDVMNTFTGWGYPLQIARYVEIHKKKKRGRKNE